MLINLRNALMAGKRLPYDAEVEYLESTGTQYIDTGFKANTTTTRLEASIEFTNPTSTQGVFGSRNRDTGNAESCNAFILASNIFRPDWAAGGGSSSYNITISPNTIYEISITRSRLTINGVEYIYGNSVSYDQIYNFLLFNFSNAGSVFSSGLKGRLRYAKIYSNGVLVRDFIPVRKGTVGYLYDRVSGKLFGNAGTGDFVLGPDVVPVEYIESHGTEWIDTGVLYSDPCTIRVTAELTPTNEERDLFGAYGRASVQGNMVCGVYNRFVFLFIESLTRIDSSVMGSNPVMLTVECDFADNQRTLIVNGQSYSQNAVSYNGENITIFRGNVKASYIGIFKCYHFSIMRANTLASSFRPVRVGSGSSWEGAMMDVLTRRIYRNAGTGAFTYGNDLKYPIPSE